MQALDIVYQSVLDMGRTFLAALPNLLIAVMVLLLTWVATRVVNKILSRTMERIHLRVSLQDLFGKIATTLCWTLGLMVAIAVVFPEFTPSKILTVLGLGSVAIGFAFKDVFENFLAGVLILLREPFRLGDFIEVSDYLGKVENVTIRDTHIRQSDGQRIVLPNAILFKNPVKVVTDKDQRRTTITCGVGYGENIDKARSVIARAVSSAQTLAPNRPVQIFAKEFGASSVDFEVTWWTGSQPRDIRESRDEVVARVKSALDEAGIEIPFPYRTLTFAESLPIQKPERQTSSVS